MHQSIESIKELENAQAYLASSRTGDPRGTYGWVLLLNARLARENEEQIAFCDRAIEYLRNGDRCSSCQYALACALSKRFSLTHDPNADEYLNEAKGALLYSLGELQKRPYQLDARAVADDPFLKPLITLPDVKTALSDFVWTPPSVQFEVFTMYDFIWSAPPYMGWSIQARRR